MKKVTASLIVLAASAQSALAVGIPDGTVVPEISAMEGAAAIAAVLAIVALVWERRRRAA